MRASQPALYLLTVPAFALGWLLGASEPPAPRLLNTSTKTEPRTKGATPFPDFHANDGAGASPSFVEVSLRILSHARGASPAQLTRLQHEMEDARHGTDPGYELARRAIVEEFQRRAPDRYLVDTPDASARRKFFKDWGARDLRAAFEAALQTPPPGQRLFNLRAVLEKGAVNDPETALALVRSIADRRLREAVARRAIMPALKNNPELCTDLAREFPSQASAICYFAVEAMTERDPAEAIAAVADFPAEWQERARSALVQTWSQTDHAAAYRWAQEQGVPVPEALYRNWAWEDPAPALEAAIAKEAFRGPSAVNDLAQMISDSRPEHRQEIVDWLATVEDDALRARLAAGLCRGRGEPTAAELEAATFGAAHPSGHWDDYKYLANRIEDPVAQREFIQSLPPIVSRETMTWFAGEWLQQQPEGFAKYVESIPTVRGRRHFFESALSSGNEQYREALRQFAIREGIDVP